MTQEGRLEKPIHEKDTLQKESKETQEEEIEINILEEKSEMDESLEKASGQKFLSDEQILHNG